MSDPSADPAAELTEGSLPPAPDSQPAAEPTLYARLLRKVWFILWGAIAPGGFLLASGLMEDNTLWQSGDIGVYCLLVCQLKSIAWLLPFALFSSLGLVKQTFTYRTRPPSTWVVVAMLSGVVLWAELFVVWCGGISHDIGSDIVLILLSFVCPITGFIAVQPVLAITGLLASTDHDDERPMKVHYLAVLVLTLISLPFVWHLWLLLPLFCAAPLALFTYVCASWEVLRSLKQRWRVSLSAILIAFAWLSANFAAWRMAILAAIEEYSRLPTEAPPRCFIVTAAAQGHPRLVGSRDLGQAFPVNRQLQRLKAAELVLAVTLPRTHRRLRRLYNRVGPRVARGIHTAWLADVSYLLLKPLEWSMWLLVRGIAGVPKRTIEKVYDAGKPR